MWAWLAWLLERDVTPMSTPLQTKPHDENRLTVGQIDEMLGHWSRKLHTDPDPLNRWATIVTCDAWLDCRNRLMELTDGEAAIPRPPMENGSSQASE